MQEFSDYCREYIQDNIRGYVGQTHYGGDLPFAITQGPNWDGTLTYSRQMAMDYLREWWFDCADYFDWEQGNLGTCRNPFDNPEAYMVCMVIEGVNNLISQSPTFQKYWNEEFELTEEIADRICEEVNDLTVKF